VTYATVPFDLQLRVGLELEIEWGTWRYIQVYFGAGVLSAAFSAVFMPQYLSVGASGALLGLLGVRE
jgi:membrane associated rhomboid family serine protease